MFDTLKYVKQLEGVGYSREQAETHMQIMVNVIETDLATSQDMTDLRRQMRSLFSELRAEMDDLSTELRAEMKDLATELRTEMKDLSTDLRTEMKDLGTELRSEMSALNTDLREEMKDIRTDMKEMEYRLTIKMGVALATVASIQVAAVVALVKLL